MTKLFLLRPGALGDLLLTVPALMALKSQIPKAHITLAGHAEGVRLLQESSIIDVGMSQDDIRLLGLFASRNLTPVEADPAGGFDVAVAWLRDPEGIVGANLGRFGARKIIVAPSAPPAHAGTHVSDHLVASLSPLGIQPLEGGGAAGQFPPQFRPSADAESWARECLSARNPTGAPVAAIHPGSGSARKNWPPSHFAAVARSLARDGFTVLLIRGPADESPVDAVQSNLETPLPVFRDLPLSRLAALLFRCSVYLGNDSGVTHLAGLVGVPVVALFGPTDPRTWGPRGKRVTILTWKSENAELSPETVTRTLLEKTSATLTDEV